MLPLIALLSIPSIEVPAGYYTLRELSGVLAKQGVSIDPRSDCENEVYAIRMGHATPEGVLHALAATGRLSLEPGTNGVNRLRRSDRVRTTEPVLLDRYLQACFAVAIKYRPAAARQLAEWLAMPWAARNHEIEVARREAEKKKDVDLIATLRLASEGIYGDGMTFMDFTVPLHLASLGRKGVGSFQVYRFDQWPGMFFPTGLRGKTKPFCPSAFIVPPEYDVAGAKLRLDPISGASTIPIVLSVLNEPAHGWDKVTRSVFFTNSVAGPPRPDDVFRPGELSEYRSRLALTENEMVKGNGAKPVDLRKASMTVSEALLRSSILADQNLVAYVSPLSDRPIVPVADTSLQELVRAINKGAFDAAFGKMVVRERSGFANEPPPAAAEWPSLTATMADGTLVVRTESDFLDALVEGPPTLPTALENAALNGTPPSLGDLAKHIAGLKLEGWSGSTFSTRYLRYTNPTAFYPVARALAGDPDLLAKASALGLDEHLSVPWAQIKPAIQQEIESAIGVAGDHCDETFENLLEPICAGSAFRVGTHPPYTSLLLRRIKGKYWFSVMILKNTEYWACWVDHVRAPA